MSGYFKKLIPPANWRVPVTILNGILVGLFLYILNISNAVSYLSDEPETCINCHVMNPQYATWNHSSHREVATCNDCHVPQNNIFNKYYFKAKDGLRHATAFTMRAEPPVIFIKEEGKKVVQQNCIRCHERLITDDQMVVLANDFHGSRTDRQCWTCHRETPHGRVNSLVAVPNAIIPQMESPVPDWMKKLRDKKDKNK